MRAELLGEGVDVGRETLCLIRNRFEFEKEGRETKAERLHRVRKGLDLGPASVIVQEFPDGHLWQAGERRDLRVCHARQLEAGLVVRADGIPTQHASLSPCEATALYPLKNITVKPS